MTLLPSLTRSLVKQQNFTNKYTKSSLLILRNSDNIRKINTQPNYRTI